MYINILTLNHKKTRHLQFILYDYLVGSSWAESVYNSGGWPGLMCLESGSPLAFYLTLYALVTTKHSAERVKNDGEIIIFCCTYVHPFLSLLCSLSNKKINLHLFN